MAGSISVGGIASGLDSNAIIDQLVRLERRPIDLLSNQVVATQRTKSSIGTLSGKLTALKSAAEALNTSGEVLVRKATSSDTTVATSAAGSGAQRGTATLAVTRLARGSVAGATVGKSAATDTVAAGDGTFRFQVGSGDVQTVNVTASTTLQDLASAITALGAGASASVVNFGTAAAPDYRLQLVSTTTGDSSTISIVQDDTTLAVQTTQTGLNAQFSVSGFSTTFERESNTFDDVLTGVTISLKATGNTTVTVDDDADAIVAKVKALVTAYNDIRTFVTGESSVETSSDKESRDVGSLAGNSTVRNVVSQLQETFTRAVLGSDARYVNLASLGLATQRDGTILFTESTLRDALADDPDAVAEVLAGSGSTTGVAGNLVTLVTQLTGTGGSITSQTSSLDDQIESLQDQIDAAERNIETFELGLRQQFAGLETLIATLQQQGSFLSQALGF